MYKNNSAIFLSGGEVEGIAEGGDETVSNLVADVATLRSRVDNLKLEQLKLKVATFENSIVSFLVLVVAIIVSLAK